MLVLCSIPGVRGMYFPSGRQRCQTPIVNSSHSLQCWQRAVSNKQREMISSMKTFMRSGYGRYNEWMVYTQPNKVGLH